MRCLESLAVEKLSESILQHSLFSFAAHSCTDIQSASTFGMGCCHHTFACDLYMEYRHV